MVGLKVLTGKDSEGTRMSQGEKPGPENTLRIRSPAPMRGQRGVKSPAIPGNAATISLTACSRSEREMTSTGVCM